MRSLSCRPTRTERAAVGLFFALLVLLHLWGVRYRLDTLDEGYFVYNSSRVFAGEIPYRDFSTPYTPAFFYLNALVFKLFGLEIVAMRLAMLVPRIGVLLLAFVLGRRVMPPAFALVPAFVVLLDDWAPGVWESHPAWWSSFLALVSVWCVCRYRERGVFGWWVAACLVAGASFAFKQNIGIFISAALVTLALSEARALPGVWAPGVLDRFRLPLPPRLAELARRLAGPAALLALCFGATWGMRAHLNAAVFAMLALPFAALAVERVRRPAYDATGEVELMAAAPPGPAATRARLGALAAAFALVNLPWLAALTLVLGPSETPYAAFVGAIDTAGYYFPLEPPRSSAALLVGLVSLAPAGLWVASRPWSLAARLGLLAVVAALAAVLIGALFALAGEVHPRLLRAWVLVTVDASWNLILYLPSLAFWTGFGLLATGRVPPRERFYLRWYLLAGSLLLLNQYPRMDEPHLPYSAPLLYVVGAYVLWRLYRALTRGLGLGRLGRLQRVAMFLALLGLPLIGVWPTVEVRRSDLVIRQEGSLLELAPPRYEWLDLPGVNVYELEDFAEKWRRLHAYFRDHSAPGERIFVYPAAPLLYYLVDRPNGSRFAHLLPGLLSPSDERETIRRLETVPVRYVIWDTFGQRYWIRPGTYQTLETYIWEWYEPVESVGGFEVLRRRDGAPAARLNPPQQRGHDQQQQDEQQTDQGRDPEAGVLVLAE